MTEQFLQFRQNIENIFFQYAHITGALELYDFVLRDKNLQERYFGTEFKEIHRYHDINGVREVWYPAVPIEIIIAMIPTMKGSVFGFIIRRFIEEIDFYLDAVAKSRGEDLGRRNKLKEFDKKICRISDIEAYPGIFRLREERHVIVHNQGRLDRKFVDKVNRELKLNLPDSLVGMPIRKSHLEMLRIKDIVVKFVQEIESRIEAVE